MGRLLIVLCLMPALAGSALAHDSETPAAAEVEAAISSGRYADAETLSRAHLQALRATAGPESLETIDAADLHLRALILNGRGALPATVELAQINAIQKERAVGASDPALASSLVTLGQVLSLSAKHSEAIRVLDRAVALLDRPGASAARLTSALDELGRVLGRAEQYDRAIVVLRRSLALKESAGILGRPLALTLQSLGAILQSKGEYPQARALIERALALHRREGPDHPEAIDSWTQLGHQLFFEGRLTESRDTYQEAVDLAERTLSPDHPTLVYALKDLESP